MEALAEVHRAADPTDALAIADQLVVQPGAAELGVDYLRGELLAALGQTEAAARAFVQAMQRVPLLAPYCRLRLAELQGQRHPEMAAGLLAPLVDAGSPAALRHQAAVLLHRALRAGGDCRVLEGLGWAALGDTDRRALSVARAECAAVGGPPESAVTALAALLADDAADEAAWEAAVRLSGMQRDQLPPEVALALGRTFERLRQPELASAFLGPLVSSLPAQLREERQAEAFELLAQAQVARDANRSAIGTFARLAARVTRADLRARAYFHEGWAREVAGDRSGALQGYVRAANLTAGIDLTGRALLAACRVQWLLGRRPEALRSYEILRSRREWSEPAAEAGMFLAVSLLAAGEVGNAPGLLQQAIQLRARTEPETVYWIARADEAQGDASAALAQYLHLLRELPYHPLSAQARLRLAGPAMEPTVHAAIERWRRSPRPDDRLAAWLLLPASDPQREPLRLYLYQQWARDRHLAPYLRLAAVDPREWPLWTSPLDGAEDRVLALGGWAEVGLDTILRHFPLAEPDLAFTAAQRLLLAHDPARALALVQRVAAPALRATPPQLLPLPLRQALFPQPWPHRVDAAARRQGIASSLLWALMREGSRFDRAAATTWGGRGLLLLDPASAERAAPLAGLPGVRPDDLYDPEVAIAIGAARLAQLGAAFPGRPVLAIAAHLAGVPQARLWSSWCATSDPAEQLAKIGSPEVRATVGRILGAQMAYEELPPGR